MALSAWVCRFDDREIRVVNTWFSGLKVYVDGVHMATHKGLFAFSKSKPLVRVPLVDSAGVAREIRVIVSAWVTVRCAIFVDDVQYGGEVLDLTVDAARFPVDNAQMKALGTGSGSALGVPAKVVDILPNPVARKPK